MTQNVYITKLSRFLPNAPVLNDEIEDFLGRVNNKNSRSKNIVLRNNGIKARYYAMDKSGNSTHSNAALTGEAIKKFFDSDFSAKDIQLLCCGTSSPDQLLPSHASMVQGIIGGGSYEVMSPAGSCNSGMQALKYGYMSILSGITGNAVCAGSEKLSTWMHARHFEGEAPLLEKLQKNPYLAFEKDFLRWMLSDGAAAAVLCDRANPKGRSLQINWIDISSYASEKESCMYAGAVQKNDGALIPWRDLPVNQLFENSVFSLRQDTRVLEGNITRLGTKSLLLSLKKHNLTIDDIDFFLPHMSSEFFRKKIAEDAAKSGNPIPEKKWFTNLTKFGNIGAASGLLMLEELFNENALEPGMKIMLMVPESARFAYSFALFTVV